VSGQSVMAGMLAEMNNGAYLLLGVLCLVMLSVSMLRRSHQRSATARDLTREQLARLRDQRDVRQSMDELLIQLEEVSRRINAQVDTRFAKLEAVIRDADERIARLGTLTPAKPPPGRNVKRAEQRAAAVHPPAESDGGGLPARQADTPTKGDDGPPVAGQEEQRRRVYEMADSGALPITIADALNLPLGEVELILNLRDFG